VTSVDSVSAETRHRLSAPGSVTAL